MSEGREMKAVIQHLRTVAMCGKGDGPSDGQLLECFLVRRDETAFTTLVRRHGAMVLGVCQRVLRNVHDAEDAFQATFLVLARKAASVRPRDMVGSWLYGVAYRTALKARTMNAKRRAKERQAGQLPRSESSADEELLAQLDYELNRLPDKYRVPIVLCELEGRSRKEVARLLGVPEGTLSWRLAQAKKMLAKKLSRHGLAVTGGVLAAVMAPGTASAFLRASTVKAALTAGAVPAEVLTLTEGVIKTMLLSKLKITACAAALMMLAGVGATALTHRATAQQPRAETTRTSRPQADELEALRLEIEALRKSLQATRERVRTLEEEVATLKKAERNPARTMPGGGPKGGMPPGPRGTGSGGRPGGPTKGTPPLPDSGSNVPRDNTPGPTSKPYQPGSSSTPSTATPYQPGSRSTPSTATPYQPGSSSAPSTTTPYQWGSSSAPSTTTNPFSQPSDTTAYPKKRESSPDSPRQESSDKRDSSSLPPSGSASRALVEAALQRLRRNPDNAKAIELLEQALKQLKEQKKQKPIGSAGDQAISPGP
jgi:RNA polymerase sigma factor (sigma-70 family)